jgi:hypothetical protein
MAAKNYASSLNPAALDYFGRMGQQNNGFACGNPLQRSGKIIPTSMRVIHSGKPALRAILVKIDGSIQQHDSARGGPFIHRRRRKTPSIFIAGNKKNWPARRHLPEKLPGLLLALIAPGQQIAGNYHIIRPGFFRKFQNSLWKLGIGL